MGSNWRRASTMVPCLPSGRAYPPKRARSLRGYRVIRPRPPSLLEDRHRPDRARRAASDFEREADEPEASPAHELVEVPQALHVRDVARSAGQVGLEVGFALRCRADRLD